jgi:hypothetical protein
MLLVWLTEGVKLSWAIKPLNPKMEQK